MIAIAYLAAMAVAVPAGSWRLVWHDEFNGRAIDPNKWRFALECRGGGNHELILNLAVGGGLPESRDLKTVDAPAFPVHFDFDYVRVWSLEPARIGRPTRPAN